MIVVHPAETQEIDTGAFLVRARVRSGPRPVVFVHGLAASSAFFLDAWECEELAERGLVALDLPGFGETDAPKGFGFTMREQADVLAEAIEALDLREVTLMGHSMGGTIAVLAAERLVPRLEALVLAEGVLRRDVEIWSEALARRSPDAWAREFADIRRRPQIFARGLMQRRRTEALTRITPAVTQTTAEAVFASAVDVQQAAGDPSLYDRFVSLDLPRCFVYADFHEGMGFVDRLRRDGIPLAVVPRAGHAMMLDNPAAFYRIVAGSHG